MKIYIFSDMEGISGISQSSHVIPGNVHYPLGCKLMEMDINACIEGCFKAGADAVVVRDGHGSGVNVNPLKINPRAELIQGDSGTCRFPGIDGYDALILLGYHAMAGTPNAILEHTFSSRTIQNMWLNGKLVGEFAIDAMIAAEYGTHTVMVSGDDKICAEASDFLPQIVSCQVKTALTSSGARLLSPQKARELITAKTIEAVGQIGKIPLLPVISPTCLKTEIVERGVLPSVSRKDLTIIDGRTYEVRRKTLEAALLD
jgi:D-amino peptidase